MCNGLNRNSPLKSLHKLTSSAIKKKSALDKATTFCRDILDRFSYWLGFN